MTETTPFHVGLTPERVTDAALELTGESHLLTWSIRDLARRLDVVPSVIYHHVGGKELLARHVVERVLEDLQAPDRDLPWHAWFRRLLADAYRVATPYPGVAMWLLMHGPMFPPALAIMQDGLSTLRRAGFDDRAELAYAALLNNAMLTISIGDERLRHEEDGPRDHDSMMAEFRRVAAQSPDTVALADDFTFSFGAPGSSPEQMRAVYYDFVTEITIGGLAALPPGPSQS